jgi:hypothetical protein
MSSNQQDDLPGVPLNQEELKTVCQGLSKIYFST